MAATVRTVALEQGASIDLVRATIDRFERWSGTDVGVGLDFSTTIPRSVGLAGSSAIVIGCLRALAAHGGHAIDDDEVAVLAHTIERGDLGIAGGWQDQMVQSRGASSIMDFADGRSIRPLSSPAGGSIPFYLAWSSEVAEDSGAAHAELRAGRPPSPDHIAELRSLGHAAATAVENRAVHDLKLAIDRTFDIRRSMMSLTPSHRDMVETARSLGACANFAGSGGAIVGVLPKASATFVEQIERAGLQIRTWEHT